MVESSDKTWSTGKGNGKPLQYSSLENPMSSMKRQKDRTLIDELPRFLGAQYATGKQWRNNSRKNEQTEPKQKQHPVVDVTGNGSKIRCCKKQYCIGTRSEERRVGLPKTAESRQRGLTKHGPLEKGIANHFSILALRTP